MILADDLRWRALRSVALATEALLLDLSVLAGTTKALVWAGAACAGVLAVAGSARKLPYAAAMRASSAEGSIEIVTGGRAAMPVLTRAIVGAAVILMLVLIADAAGVADPVAGGAAGALTGLAVLRIARAMLVRRHERRSGDRLVRLRTRGVTSERTFVSVRD